MLEQKDRAAARFSPGDPTLLPRPGGQYLQEYDAMSAAERLEVAQKVSLAMQQLAKAENTKEVL